MKRILITEAIIDNFEKKQEIIDNLNGMTDEELKNFFNRKVWFHGSKNKELVFTDPKEGKSTKSKMQLDFGTHFSSKEYASTYGKVHPVFLNFKNPLNLSAPEIYKGEKNFNNLYDFIHTLKLQKEYMAISKTDKYGDKQDEVSTVMVNAHYLNRLSPQKVFNALLKHGFDSVVYNPYQPTGLRGFIPQDISVIILKKDDIIPISFENIADEHINKTIKNALNRQQ